MQDMHLLAWMLLIPICGAGLVLLLARQGLDQVRWIALGNVLLSCGAAVALVISYDPARHVEGRPELLQMRTDMRWLQVDAHSATGAATEADRRVGPNIRFSLGVDGISLWLIALTAVLMIPAVLGSWEAVQDRAATYYALMLMLQAGLVGVFSAQDIILFYLFFEFTLIPLFFMIGIWGGNERRWAARKFFIYTFAGSVLTFLSLVFIVLSYSWMTGNPHLTFSIPELTQGMQALLQDPAQVAARDYWMKVSPWVFLGLFAGFAIKVPLFPFHTWLPLAHVQAPTAGSVLLAGVLLKIGSYGFMRFALPLAPEACWQFLPAIALLSVIGVVYGALLALAQDDIKKLVAYSSVSHMGFCMLGLFALNSVGLTGGLLQMVNHGLSTGALFAIVGMLYERYHTRDIDAFGGLARKFPWLTFFLVTVAFSSIGLPGLNGFTGEVLSLMGMFRTHAVYGVFGLTGIILGAWYTLWLVQRTFYGRLREPLGGHGHAGHGHTGHSPAALAGTIPVLPAGGLPVAHGMAAGDAHMHAAPGGGPAGHHDLHAGHGSTAAHGDHGSHGHVHGAVFGPPYDMNPRELCALAPILVLIFWIGLFPQFFISRMEPSIREISVALEDGRQRVVIAQRKSAVPVLARQPGRLPAPNVTSALVVKE